MSKRAQWHEHRREKWDKNGPPWSWHENGEWADGPPLPPWLRHRKGAGQRHASGGLLFFRFVLAFGLLVLLGCGVMAMLGAAAVLFLQQRPLPPDSIPTGSPASPLRWILILLGLAFVLALILRHVGRSAARRFTDPLSETMRTADALARGDLSARVPVAGGPEFRHFARSFNRMAEALEAADQQRRALLADIAHELRTPLTVIQGNLEGLRDGVYEISPDHLDLLLDETQKLSRLVEDLRLLTLAEAGQLPLDRQILNVPQLLCDVRDGFDPQAQEAGLQIALDVEHALPPLFADPQRLGQVLGNLVSNALHYTPPGGRVILGASPVTRDQGLPAIRLWVQDTGQGIPAGDLPRIFDRFWRGDPARTREDGSGTGLGLAIAKSLVEAHGGRIWAESQESAGTTVSFILPPADEQAPEPVFTPDRGQHP